MKFGIFISIQLFENISGIAIKCLTICMQFTIHAAILPCIIAMEEM